MFFSTSHTLFRYYHKILEHLPLPQLVWKIGTFGAMCILFLPWTISLIAVNWRCCPQLWRTMWGPSHGRHNRTTRFAFLVAGRIASCVWTSRPGSNVSMPEGLHRTGQRTSPVSWTSLADTPMPKSLQLPIGLWHPTGLSWLRRYFGRIRERRGSCGQEGKFGIRSWPSYEVFGRFCRPLSLKPHYGECVSDFHILRYRCKFRLSKCMFEFNQQSVQQSVSLPELT